MCSKAFLKVRPDFSSLTGKQVEQELTLDDARLNCYKAFYTGLQSKNVTIGAALNLWDILLRLELTYDSMAKIFGPEAEQQKAYYERLQRMAEEFATSRDVGRLGPRRPTPNLKALLPNFYHQVQEAAVSLPAIIGAPLFWHYHASRTSYPPAKQPSSSNNSSKPIPTPPKRPRSKR